MNQILVTQQNQEWLYCALINDRLEYMEWEADDHTDEIRIGRVENIVENIHAAFIRYDKEQTGYLSLKDVVPKAVLNRTFREGDRLRCGDDVAVQIRSAALKTKQPHLTCQLALAGRYCVLTLGKKGVGCSLKLSGQMREYLIREVREKLKAEAPAESTHGPALVFSEDYGILLRTEAGNEGTSLDDVYADIHSTLNRIQELLGRGRQLCLYSVLYRKDAVLSVNDHLMNLYHFCKRADAKAGRILTDDSSMRNMIMQTDLLRMHPELETEYHDPEESNLKLLYGLGSKMEECLQKKVWLKSGGYLVVEQTEAMNVIDVNTGKSITGKQNIFEQINLEAAAESLRQIRLRNLSGMIMIDFINMDDPGAYERLQSEIERLALLDPVRVQFTDFTGLGIAELTRSKKGKSLIDNQNIQ